MRQQHIEVVIHGTTNGCGEPFARNADFAVRDDVELLSELDEGLVTSPTPLDSSEEVPLTPSILR